MLRFAAILALVAVGCCSAFHLEASDAVKAYVAAQGESAVGRNLWFPCFDGVTAKEMEGLDLNRFQGHWFTTNGAFSTSHYFDTNKIQKAINQATNCGFNAFNYTNPNAPAWQQLIGLRQPLNASVVIPGWQVVNNRTGLFRSLNVTTPRAGDNGWWHLPVDLGNSTTLWVDSLIVATDYTNSAIWYTCQDIPVPFTADTVREQQWGIQRRKPQNFNAVELAVLKLAALSRGIRDMDHLYTFPTDGCF